MMIYDTASTTTNHNTNAPVELLGVQSSSSFPTRNSNGSSLVVPTQASQPKLYHYHHKHPSFPSSNIIPTTTINPTQIITTSSTIPPQRRKEEEIGTVSTTTTGVTARSYVALTFPQKVRDRFCTHTHALDDTSIFRSSL